MNYVALMARFLRSRRDSLAGRAGRPYKLEFFLTGQCNSRCTTCSIWRNEEPARELSAEQVGRTAESVGKGLLWVSLTGGEALLRDDLADVVAALVAGAPTLRFINLSSNGLLTERTGDFMERVLPLLEERRIPLTITLSLDHLGERYDKLRGVPGGFTALVRTAALLKRTAAGSKFVSYTFQVTLSGHNLDQTHEILGFAMRNSGGFTPVITLSSDSFLLTDHRTCDLRRLGPAHAADLERIARRYPIVRLQDLISRLYLRMVPAFLRTGRAPIPCTAGRAALTIDRQGGLRRCDYLQNSFGDLSDYGFDLSAMIDDLDQRAAAGDSRAQALFSDCRNCFTPCQAYPSIIDYALGNPLSALKLLLT